MRQHRIPAVFYRGGTSKALIFRREDLPADPELRDRVILAAYGSPDPYRRQLDGLGGAVSSTSKVAIVGPASRPDADVDYTFGQVGIEEALVDWGGTCGNISAAIGPYAIEEGLVPAREPVTPVRVFNTNTGKLYIAHVPVAEGTFNPDGDYAIQGVPGTGARIVLDYLDPGGGVSGQLLPTGRPRDAFPCSLEPGSAEVLDATLVDAGNPLAICRLADLGLSGLELPPALDANAELMARLEAVRAHAAVACGLARAPREAGERSPAIPKVAFVAAPRAYTATDGTRVAESEMDVLARMLSMGRVHTSYALTGAIATAVAAVLPGTVVYELARPACRQSGWVRIGHPAGVLEVGVEVREVDGQLRVTRVSTARTARRLMDGYVYVPASRVGRGGLEVGVGLREVASRR